jgi:heme-degrading monooxygenase HmoA
MTTPAQTSIASVFRIDSFTVPSESREAFLAQVLETKQFLDGQEGCLQNHVLQLHSGAERFNVVTVVEWQSETAFAQAKAAMMAKRRVTGFNAEHFLNTLGIEANMANYAAVP